VRGSERGGLRIKWGFLILRRRNGQVLWIRNLIKRRPCVLNLLRPHLTLGHGGLRSASLGVSARQHPCSRGAGACGTPGHQAHGSD
jgi:hypothetical protein